LLKSCSKTVEIADLFIKQNLGHVYGAEFRISLIGSDIEEALASMSFFSNSQFLTG